MNDPCHLLRAAVPEIVRRWEELVVRTPWASLPAPPPSCATLDVVVCLMESGLCERGRHGPHRELVHAAARLGQHRRLHGAGEADVLTDYSLLRRALWAQIRSLPLGEERALQAVSHLDMALTTATLAGLRGYHREQIERLGRWPELLEQTLQESPLTRMS